MRHQHSRKVTQHHDLPSSEAPHAVEDVELLPVFVEVDVSVGQLILVADVDKSQVLENQAPGNIKLNS